jgi:hypothetical protein
LFLTLSNHGSRLHLWKFIPYLLTRNSFNLKYFILNILLTRNAFLQCWSFLFLAISPQHLRSLLLGTLTGGTNHFDETILCSPLLRPFLQEKYTFKLWLQTCQCHLLWSKEGEQNSTAHFMEIKTLWAPLACFHHCCSTAINVACVCGRMGGRRGGKEKVMRGWIWEPHYIYVWK